MIRNKTMEVHQTFHAIAGIPQVLGVLSRALIAIPKPLVIDQTFISRTGFTALNVQVVVDRRGSQAVPMPNDAFAMVLFCSRWLPPKKSTHSIRQSCDAG